MPESQDGRYSARPPLRRQMTAASSTSDVTRLVDQPLSFELERQNGHASTSGNFESFFSCVLCNLDTNVCSVKTKVVIEHLTINSG